MSLSIRLRSATHPLHRLAERSGMMRALIGGRLERPRYVALLRNLHALYQALEAGLEANQDSPAIAAMTIPSLFRSAGLRADLAFYENADWETLPLTPSMHDYVARVVQLSHERPLLLAAHAYVRYLGDLNGGQLLKGIVARSFAPVNGGGTAFYEFGSDADIERLKDGFRAAVDRIAADDDELECVVAEAVSAFRRHIDLFQAL